MRKILKLKRKDGQLVEAKMKELNLDYIDLYFKYKEVTIHRDIRDISQWGSIKKYIHH